MLLAGKPSSDDYPSIVVYCSSSKEVVIAHRGSGLDRSRRTSLANTERQSVFGEDEQWVDVE
jgi:hypothetical protein